MVLWYTLILEFKQNAPQFRSQKGDHVRNQSAYRPAFTRSPLSDFQSGIVTRLRVKCSRVHLWRDKRTIDAWEKKTVSYTCKHSSLAVIAGVVQSRESHYKYNGAVKYIFQCVTVFSSRLRDQESLLMVSVMSESSADCRLTLLLSDLLTPVWWPDPLKKKKKKPLRNGILGGKPWRHLPPHREHIIWAGP